jgi:hypothetical protein
MKRLTATICLTITVLLGSTGVSWTQTDPLSILNPKNFASFMEKKMQPMLPIKLSNNLTIFAVKAHGRTFITRFRFVSKIKNQTRFGAIFEKNHIKSYCQNSDALSLLFLNMGGVHLRQLYNRRGKIFHQFTINSCP